LGRYSLWWLLQPKHAAHRDDEHSDRNLPSHPAVFEQPEWRQVKPEVNPVDAIGGTIFSILGVLSRFNPLRKKRLSANVTNVAKSGIHQDDDSDDGDEHGSDGHRDRNGVPDFPLFILNPRSLMMLYWNLTILILVCLNMCICPFRYAFEYMQLQTRVDSPLAQPHWGIWNSLGLWMEYGIDAFFALDIIVQVNTAFFKEQEGEFKLIVDRSEVFWHHVKRWFLVDAAVGFPFEFQRNWRYHLAGGELQLPNQLHIFVRYCRIVKFFKLGQLFKITRVGNLDHHISSLKERIALLQGPLRVIKFLVAFLYTLHFVSCLLFIVARVFDDSLNDSWIQHVGMMVVSEEGPEKREFSSFRALNDPGLGISNQYLASLYYMTTTLTQVGYGDFLPVSFYEVAILTIAMVAGENTATFGAYGGSELLPQK